MWVTTVVVRLGGALGGSLDNKGGSRSEPVVAGQPVVIAAGGRLPNAYGVDLAIVNDPTRPVAEYVTDAGGWTIGAESHKAASRWVGPLAGGAPGVW